MVLIIITAVMEVSVIIISCILYHCKYTRKRKAKMDFTGQRQKNEMVQQTIFFWNMQMPIFF